MKKHILCGLTAVTLALSGINLAYADTQTVTVGYAQAKIKDLKNMKGINAQYHYDFNNNLGIAVSGTYMQANDKSNSNQTTTDKLKSKYYSVLAGPEYRINDMVAVYGLVGVSSLKNDRHCENESTICKEKSSHVNLAYGAGVQVNPIKNFAVNVGYEGTRSKIMNGKEKAINGINIGVGYSF